MRCAGCHRDLEIGDQYIKFTMSEFAKAEGLEQSPAVAELDDLFGDIMGSQHGDDIIYCEDCTERGGQWRFDTFYGDEEGSANG